MNAASTRMKSEKERTTPENRFRGVPSPEHPKSATGYQREEESLVGKPS